MTDEVVFEEGKEPEEVTVEERSGYIPTKDEVEVGDRAADPKEGQS